MSAAAHRLYREPHMEMGWGGIDHNIVVARGRGEHVSRGWKKVRLRKFRLELLNRLGARISDADENRLIQLGGGFSVRPGNRPGSDDHEMLQRILPFRSMRTRGTNADKIRHRNRRVQNRRRVICHDGTYSVVDRPMMSCPLISVNGGIERCPARIA